MRSARRRNADEIETLMLFMRSILGQGRGPDVHRHRCPKCACVWRHQRPPDEAGEEEYRAAHLCPRGCGEEVRERYRGDAPTDEDRA
jgi:hypothetical protein